jgi:hypothetical protein
MDKVRCGQVKRFTWNGGSIVQVIRLMETLQN